MSNFANVGTLAERFTLHATGTQLSCAEGYHSLTVKGDPNSGRPGATVCVPAVTAQQVIDWSFESPEIAAAIAGIAAQAQRDIIRAALANGAKPGSSLAVADVTGESVRRFLLSAGASTLRLTKELVEKFAPCFRTAIAARWAEVKGVADSLSEAEILAGSRATQERYLTVLEAIRAGSLVSDADEAAMRRLLAMTAEAGGDDAQTSRLILSKLDALAAKRAGLLDDAEDL